MERSLRNRVAVLCTAPNAPEVEAGAGSAPLNPEPSGRVARAGTAEALEPWLVPLRESVPGEDRGSLAGRRSVGGRRRQGRGWRGGQRPFRGRCGRPVEGPRGTSSSQRCPRRRAGAAPVLFRPRSPAAGLNRVLPDARPAAPHRSLTPARNPRSGPSSQTLALDPRL